MFKTIASFFSGGVGGIILTILPYLLGAGLLTGAYFYVDHRGFTRAQKLCDTATLKATISAQDAEIKSIRKQLVAADVVLAELKEQKNKVITNTITLRKVIEHEIKVNAACDIPPSVVRVLNEARATGRNP
jgi:hypothetical protein